MPLMTREELHARVEALKRQYPLMFAHVPCGAGIVPGWVELVEALCADIDAAMTLQERRNFQIGQIKEKFGALRFYASVHNDRSIELVREAERMSAGICVYCGAPGSIRNFDSEKNVCTGWIHPACDDHAGRQFLFSDEEP